MAITTVPSGGGNGDVVVAVDVLTGTVVVVVARGGVVDVAAVVDVAVVDGAVVEAVVRVSGFAVTTTAVGRADPHAPAITAAAIVTTQPNVHRTRARRRIIGAR